jgi:hypothetical protein
MRTIMISPAFSSLTYIIYYHSSSFGIKLGNYHSSSSLEKLRGNSFWRSTSQTVCLIRSFRGNREHSVPTARLPRTHNATSQFPPSKKGISMNLLLQTKSSSHTLISGSFLLQICNVFFFYIIQASLRCLRATQQIYISFARRSSRSVSRFVSFLHSFPFLFLFLFFVFCFLFFC